MELEQVFALPEFHRFRNIEEELRQVLFEREDASRAVLLSLLCRQHTLFVGLPGTAKSKMLDLACRAISGRYFYRLLQKATPPELLIGPLSVKALREEDLLKHNLAGGLAEADVALLDETFSGNSAALQVTNTILAEGWVQNGVDRVRVRLISMFGATNELPDWRDQPALLAVYDRFLFRLVLDPIREKENFLKLLATKPPEELTSKVTLEELAFLQRAVWDVEVPHEISQLMWALHKRLNGLGVWVSDRRWQWSVGALQANAFLEKRQAVDLEDLLVLRHILWNDPAQERMGVESLIIEVVFPYLFTARQHWGRALEQAKLAQEGKDLRERQVEIGRIRTQTAALVGAARSGFESRGIISVLIAVDTLSREIDEAVRAAGGA